MNRRRVAALVRIRSVMETRARADLARATSMSQRARDEAERLEARVDDWVDRSGDDPVDAAVLVQRSVMVASAEASLDAIEQHRRHLDLLAERAMEHWAVTRRDLESTERLSERVNERERRARLRSQNAELDDVAAVRHRRAEDGRR